jgi:hypothetical protein
MPTPTMWPRAPNARVSTAVKPAAQQEKTTAAYVMSNWSSLKASAIELTNGLRCIVLLLLLRCIVLLLLLLWLLLLMQLQHQAR